MISDNRFRIQNKNLDWYRNKQRIKMQPQAIPLQREKEFLISNHELPR